MKILANDGLAPDAKEKLESKGFTVTTDKVEQKDLIKAIQKENFEGIIVRSATTVRKEIIDACPNLKFIGRAGVGMDNIDVEYARSKGVTVENTPAASSQSVAELVIGTLFSLSRSTFLSYQEMPVKGSKEFNVLKKKYSKGFELRGKTLLIIGFGRIGRSLASYALGVGMKVIAVDQFEQNFEIPIQIEGMDELICNIITTTSLEAVIGQADYISIHVPKQDDGSSVIGTKEFNQMKSGVCIVNAARGGVVNESDLIDALNSGKVAAAAIDVFENEPTPREDILKHPKIATTPHIGAATEDAQSRIGFELADKIIELYS